MPDSDELLQDSTSSSKQKSSSDPNIPERQALMGKGKVLTQSAAGLLRFREPRSQDGSAVFSLIERCPPLDINSRYFNLIQCLHFADTCVLAEDDKGIVGFLSGHIPPGKPDVLFLWQLAVDERARGVGLASRLIDEMLARPGLAQIRYIETTITPDNQASQGVFLKLARRLSADLERKVLFEREQHFAGLHADEELFRIGPFNFQFSNS